MGKLVAAVAVALALCASQCLAADIIIDDANPRIQYSGGGLLPPSECLGNPSNNACESHWWMQPPPSDDYNGTSHETFGPGTYCDFEFQGDAIGLYGWTQGPGAAGIVRIDNGPSEVINWTSPDGGLHAEVLLFQTTDLDPTMNHTFHLAYDDASFGPADARRWMIIDYLVYSIPDSYITTIGAPQEASTQTSSAQTSSSSASSTDANNTTSSTVVTATSHQPSNTVAIAVGVTGGVLAGAIFAGVACFVWMRRAQSNRF